MIKLKNICIGDDKIKEVKLYMALVKSILTYN